MQKIDEIKEIKEKQVKIPSEEQRRTIMNSEEMQLFVARNYKFIERALNEKDVFDPFKSYYDDEESGNVGYN